MRIFLLTVFCVATLNWTAVAENAVRCIGKPNKPIPPYKNTPSLILQGGDTIDDAFPITSLPFYDYGTTVGYNDDYEY
jgi:hypothetical protein